MRRLPKHEMPVVPTANLVDIAILLVIFYMACSNFVSQQASVKLPQARDLEQMSQPLVLVAIDSEGVVYLQGQPVAGAEAVESGVAALLRNKTTEEMRKVMFRCDRAAGRGVFEPVLNAIVEAGGIIVAGGDKIGGE